MLERPGEGVVDHSRDELRVADVDRAFVAERLSAAIDEGRLSLSEYDERVRDAYAAKTYSDLDKLLMDLPGIAVRSRLAATGPTPVAPDAGQRLASGAAAQHPLAPPGCSGAPSAAGVAGVRPRPGARWLTAVWGAWMFAVSINVVIWLLVSVSSANGWVYFWPMWVAGPWGVLLLAATMVGSGWGNQDSVQARTNYRMERRNARIRRRADRRAARFSARRG